MLDVKKFLKRNDSSFLIFSCSVADRFPQISAEDGPSLSEMTVEKFFGGLHQLDSLSTSQSAGMQNCGHVSQL